MDETAKDILTFWFEEIPTSKHYKKDDALDQKIKDKFEPALHQAQKGLLQDWLSSPEGTLAYIILTDQFSRNIYRGDPQAFETDPLALKAAKHAVAEGFDLKFEDVKRSFFYMPFMHAEDLAAQENCVALFKERLPGSSNIPYAEQHRDIIKRFGRFPHRNETLGRNMTDDEETYLEKGGFNPT